MTKTTAGVKPLFHRIVALALSLLMALSLLPVTAKEAKAAGRLPFWSTASP